MKKNKKNAAASSGNTTAPAQPPAPEKRELRPETRYVRVDLTEKERLACGEELARHNVAITRLNEEKQSVASDFKSRIDRVQAEIGKVSERLDRGFDMKNVECRVIADDPAPGMKSIYRTDTGALLESVPMSDADKQLQLKLEQAITEKDKALIVELVGKGKNAYTIATLLGYLESAVKEILDENAKTLAAGENKETPAPAGTEQPKPDPKPVIPHKTNRSGVVVLPSEQDDFSDPEDNKPNF